MVTILKAFAKINLHLAVGEKRADGFHDLQSIFARVSLFDEIKIQSNLANELSINIKGLEKYCKAGEDTLSKAIKLWCLKTSSKLNVEINIIKNIPNEAGLGGGSSDGASVLTYLQNKYPQKALPFKELLEVGAKVGSDVPFFLYNCSYAFVSGRGEFVKPINCLFNYKVLLIKPRKGVSTKGAFSKLDKLKRKHFISDLIIKKNFNLGLNLWKKNFYNDFELVINYPLLSKNKVFDDIFVQMSGSGSTIFFIYGQNDEKKIEKIIKKLKEDIFIKKCNFI